MPSIKEKVYDVLRGKFLVSEDSLKNWGFIAYVVLLMLLMIASSHSSDKKVMKIAKLNKEVKELRAQFVDMRSMAMELKLESTIRKKVAVYGVIPSEDPPQLIKVTSNTAK